VLHHQVTQRLLFLPQFLFQLLIFDRSNLPPRRKIDPVEYEQLKQELREKEKALSDLVVEHTLLKKVDQLVSRGRLKGRSSGSEENERRL